MLRGPQYIKVEELSKDKANALVLQQMVNEYPHRHLFIPAMIYNVPTAPYLVTLSGALYVRDRKRYPSEKRYAYLASKLGAGAAGSVYSLKEFSISKDGEVVSLHKQNKPRALKLSFEELAPTFDPLDTAKQEALRNSIQKTYGFASHIQHLHIKERTVDFHFEYNSPQLSIHEEMRRMPGETLQAVINKIRKGKIVLTPMQYIKWSIGLLKTIQNQVAAYGIIHRDLKPDNIMADLQDLNKMIFNVIDYHLAMELEDDDRGLQTGAPAYRPFENWRGFGSNDKSDVYAAGVILVRFLTGYYPKGMQESYKQAKKFKLDPAAITCMPDVNHKDAIYKLLIRMTQRKAVNRPSFQEAIEELKKIKRSMQQQTSSPESHRFFKEPTSTNALVPDQPQKKTDGIVRGTKSI